MASAVTTPGMGLECNHVSPIPGGSSRRTTLKSERMIRGTDLDKVSSVEGHGFCHGKSSLNYWYLVLLFGEIDRNLGCVKLNEESLKFPAVN